MRTLEQSLKRKSTECVVETKVFYYVGLPVQLLSEIPQDELNEIVTKEYCTRVGNERQWSIFTDER